MADQKKIRNLIDRMVLESIEKNLPQILNRVLMTHLVEALHGNPSLKSITENREIEQIKTEPRRRSSLFESLRDSSAGSNFFRPDDLEPEPEQNSNVRHPGKDVLAKLPKHLQSLAADINLNEDVEPDINLDRAERAGFDFSKMKRLIG